MNAMVRTAYLRVYQPLASFLPEERTRWMDPGRDAGAEQDAARRWLLVGALPGIGSDAWDAEGAFVRETGGRVLVCPWRTRLRMLAGLVAFRGSMPEEVAEAFVPEQEARRAALELDAIGTSRPELRSHIVHANWHVPLRWFSAFEDSERILTEDSQGLRVRYETSLELGLERLKRAVEVLDSAWMDDNITEAVKELTEWLEEFPEDGLLELDYGSVAGMFSHDELVEDHTAASVNACLDALSSGDTVRAERIFGELSERWADLRAAEVLN
jgi:hypothetical protein